VGGAAGGRLFAAILIRENPDRSRLLELIQMLRDLAAFGGPDAAFLVLHSCTIVRDAT
jgi:hypothetical protein